GPVAVVERGRATRRRRPARRNGGRRQGVGAKSQADWKAVRPRRSSHGVPTGCVRLGFATHAATASARPAPLSTASRNGEQDRSATAPSLQVPTNQFRRAGSEWIRRGRAKVVSRQTVYRHGVSRKKRRAD